MKQPSLSTLALATSALAVLVFASSSRPPIKADATPVTRQVTLPPPFEIPVDLLIDDATKSWALKRAYQLNNNSMVGLTIDLTTEKPFTRVVPLERIMAPPAPITQSDISTPLPVTSKSIQQDICRGKGKRYTHNGSSWRCRK